MYLLVKTNLFSFSCHILNKQTLFSFLSHMEDTYLPKTNIRKFLFTFILPVGHFECYPPLSQHQMLLCPFPSSCHLQFPHVNPPPHLWHCCSMCSFDQFQLHQVVLCWRHPRLLNYLEIWRPLCPPIRLRRGSSIWPRQRQGIQLLGGRLKQSEDVCLFPTHNSCIRCCLILLSIVFWVGDLQWQMVKGKRTGGRWNMSRPTQSSFQSGLLARDAGQRLQRRFLGWHELRPGLRVDCTSLGKLSLVL